MGLLSMHISVYKITIYCTRSKKQLNVIYKLYFILDIAWQTLKYNTNYILLILFFTDNLK